MPSNAATTLAAPTPLGVDLLVPSTRVPAAVTSSWRGAARLAGRVVGACAAALAAGFAISIGVAAAFLLIAIAAS